MQGNCKEITDLKINDNQSDKCNVIYHYLKSTVHLWQQYSVILFGILMRKLNFLQTTCSAALNYTLNVVLS